MVFSNSTTKAGLVEDVDFLVNTNSTSYPLTDKARNMNYWLRKAAVWIWQAVHDWEFDDMNYTNLPIALHDLANNQQDVELPTTVLKIDRVEVQDDEGNWHRIAAMDKSQVTASALPEFYETAGFPKFYDVVGNSLVFYPKISSADVTTSSGLRLYLSRDISGFVSTDTTKEAGFNPLFHRICSVGAAMDYAIRTGKADVAAGLRRILTGDPNIAGERGLKGELQEFYATRHARDFKIKIMPKQERMI